MSTRMIIEIGDDLGARLARAVDEINRGRDPSKTPVTLTEVVRHALEHGVAATEWQRGTVELNDDRPISQLTVRELAIATGIFDMAEARKHHRRAKVLAEEAIEESQRIFKDAQALTAIQAPVRIQSVAELRDWGATWEKGFRDHPGFVLLVAAAALDARIPMRNPLGPSSVN